MSDHPNESDVALDELLARLGCGGANAAVTRAALEEAGLTRPGKRRIAHSKVDRVAALLRARFQVLCTRCQPTVARVAGGREPLLASRTADCELCGGSENRVAVDRLCASLLQRGLRRLVVVGGSPAARGAMQALVAGRLELRLVDGVIRRTRQEARIDMQWADVVIVWGGTQLDHKVSQLYTDTGGGKVKVIIVHHRGITGLVGECLNARFG